MFPGEGDRIKHPHSPRLVKSTKGDIFLGGEDLDNAVLEYLVDEFKRTDNFDLTNDELALQRLKEAAEKAKMDLYSTSQTEVNLPFVTEDASGAKYWSITLTRSMFEALFRKLHEICGKSPGDNPDEGVLNSNEDQEEKQLRNTADTTNSVEKGSDSGSTKLPRLK